MWCAGLIGEVLLRSRAQHRCEALLLPAEGQGDGEGGKLPAQHPCRLFAVAVSVWCSVPWILEARAVLLAVACWHLELSI